MTNFIFRIDGNYYPFPSGWDTVSLARSFDGRILKTQINGQFRFKDDLYRLLKSSAEGDPCATSEIELLFTCPPITKETLLHKGRIKLHEGVDNCVECVLIQDLIDHSRLELIEGAEEVCQDGLIDLELFQVESGNPHVDIASDATETPVTTKATPVFNVLKSISDFFDNGTGVLNSTIFGASAPDYQVQIYLVDMPTVSPGDVVQVNIQTEFGSEISGTVNVPAAGMTTNELGDAMRNTLLYVPWSKLSAPGNIDSIEMANRLSSVNSGAGAISIRADYSIEDIEIRLNGVPQVGLITETQSFQYSVKHLMVSAKGLSSDSDVCTTWDSLNNALYGLFNTVIEDQGEDIRIDSFDTVFPPTTPSSTDIENRRAEKGFDPFWMKKRVHLGSNFEIADRRNSIDNWRWVRTSHVFTASPFSNQPVGASGLGSFAGKVCVVNIGTSDELVGIDIYLNGVLVGNGLGINIQANTPAPGFCFDIPTLFQEAGDENSFCFELGDTVEVVFASNNSPNIQYGGQDPDEPFRIEYDIACLTAPSVNEIRRNQAYNHLLDFANCTGINDLRIQNDWYAGLGFAISQVVQGLASYEGSNFFIESEDGTTAKKYPRQMYIAEHPTVCDPCWYDKIITFYYYNMLLQKPHIIRNFQPRIPSDIEVRAYIINNTLGAGGVYSGTVTPKTTTIRKAHDRIEKMTMDIRQTPDDFLIRKGENVASVTDCDVTQQAGQIVQMDMNVKTGNGSIEILI